MTRKPRHDRMTAEDVALLHNQYGSLLKASQATGIPYFTLYSWARRGKVSIRARQRNRRQRKLAYLKARRLAKRLIHNGYTIEEISKASGIAGKDIEVVLGSTIRN